MVVFVRLSTLRSNEVNKYFKVHFEKSESYKSKIYNQTSIEPKCGAFYFTNKVRVHTISLVKFTSSTELKISSSFIIILLKVKNAYFYGLVTGAGNHGCAIGGVCYSIVSLRNEI